MSSNTYFLYKPTYRLFNWRSVVETVTEQDINVIKLEALQGILHAVKYMFAVQTVLVNNADVDWLFSGVPDVPVYVVLDYRVVDL